MRSLRLSVESFLLAEWAVFSQFKTIRIVFLILDRIVVSLLAFCACEDDFRSHCCDFLSLWYLNVLKIQSLSRL
jgi:hypothetical protein